MKNWFDNNEFQGRRASATFTSASHGNPFRTLPKDPPPREAVRGGFSGATGMGRGATPGIGAARGGVANGGNTMGNLPTRGGHMGGMGMGLNAPIRGGMGMGMGMPMRGGMMGMPNMGGMPMRGMMNGGVVTSILLFLTDKIRVEVNSSASEWTIVSVLIMNSL
ncbi:hypothetical protein SISNIDRAFT_62893 [Sistotremastrum niveocremeum HHB9708]|uniref:Uncharacterized protein n=1 Tax=Sistotremastrum niveocremeum HHB9708 TaxID=1314777 RepID=A0A164VKS5_9AGAM|nr:hypothetical protein SISNIDRAFT_62893 [Sistotremastrum niveocremeum HHB9708]